MATSQVSAAQWQSFEMRMRQRRVSRLVVRAQAALEQGLVADAATALEEARGLDSSTPDLATLMARLPSPEPAADLVLIPETPFDEPIVSSPERRSTGWVVVAASLAILGTLVTWGVVRLSPVLLPPTRSSSASSLAPAAVPEPPIAATTGRADALATPAAPPSAPAVDAPTASALPDTGPSAKNPSANRVDAADFDRHDADPAVLPGSRPVTPAAPSVGIAPPAPEAPRTEPVRDVPAAERIDIALPEPPPPAPVAASTSEVSVPAPVVAAPVVPEPAEPPRVDEGLLVRRVLSQYESAYSSLDVSAAKRVWPSVDSYALARAFDGLAMQRISLGDCRGSAQWTPKIGGSTRSGSRTWAFDLRKADGQWRIVDVTMR